MAAPAGLELGQAVVLLGAGVAAVTAFRWLGLGSVLGYLVGGFLVGPFVFGLVTDPETLLHVAELGVVLFLFIIGLEMRPSKLWAMRRDIFGLGAAQVLLCTALLSGVGILAGLPLPVAVVGASGFVLSSTAVIMQMLSESGELGEASGHRAVAILLFEDLMIVPLLALVALWAAMLGGPVEGGQPLWLGVVIAVAALVVLIIVGRYLLDPMFRILARAGAREVMTAAALLVVLGAALFMQAGGLSMAMGAFLAGVLLSESSFRHQLEVDIEPFRGILLGLFFLSVGMSLNLTVVIAEWRMVVAGLAAYMIVKAAAIYLVGRLFRANHAEAGHRALLFAQGGEFAFVLYGTAVAVGLIDTRSSAVLTAIVILSMVMTPLMVLVQKRFAPKVEPSLEGVEKPEGLRGQVLIIGFGRFAQIVSQPLLARGIDITLIESDVDMIRAASTFGFKVYYGDGTRLDVLHASGAATAEAILICGGTSESVNRIVHLCEAEFPYARLFVRAIDRTHAVELIKAGVDYQIRETLESALVFGETVLTSLGVSEEDAADTIADVRRRDEERLALEVVGGLSAGAPLVQGNIEKARPAPLSPPRKKAAALNEEAAAVIGEAQ